MESKQKTTAVVLKAELEVSFLKIESSRGENVVEESWLEQVINPINPVS